MDVSVDSPSKAQLCLSPEGELPSLANECLFYRNGAKIEAFGDPEDFNNGVGQVGVRILSWREIR